MRGRKRTPTSVLELRGAFKKHPERGRERDGEPEVTEPLGDPPDCLNEAIAARWREIAGWCPWLRAPDRVLLELTVRIWQGLRDGSASPADRKTLVTCLAELAMPVTERSKIKVPPKQADKNPYAELA